MWLLRGYVATCVLFAFAQGQLRVDAWVPNPCATANGNTLGCGSPTRDTTIVVATNPPPPGFVSYPVSGTQATTFATTAPGGTNCNIRDGPNIPLSIASTLDIGTANWATQPREISEYIANSPRQLCWQDPLTGNWWFTGLWIKTVTICATDATCGAARAAILTPLPAIARARVLAETKCCSGNLLPSSPIPRTHGQCINPNAASCCGSSMFLPPTELCCGPTAAPVAIVANLTGTCPCSRSTAATACPTGQNCCVQTKYPELYRDSDPGQCYNPATRKCCNTGLIYDPGVNQCCTISGIQSLDSPCPCGIDGDCTGGQVGNPLTNMLCCRQTSPPPTEVQQCTIYNNYPTGTGPASTQRCQGSCINSLYQICCNGVACVARYEKCCNSTCCNKFDGTCTEAFRAGARGVQANWVGFGQQYTQCTTIESMSVMKAFWAFIIPTSLLAIMFIGLALVMVFATRVTRKFNWVERGIIGAAIFCILFGFPTFFAPVWKYGIVVVLVSLFAIVTAAARLKWLNIACVLLVLVELIYLYDPWNGNAYLTLALDRYPTGAPHGDSAGILHSITRMYPNVRGDVNSLAYCTRFYDFFRNDPLLQDQDRKDNPLVVTFGYCSRAWTYALLMFSGVLLVFSALLFFLSIIALVLRFKDDRGYDPIELEVRGQGSKVGSYYN